MVSAAANEMAKRGLDVRVVFSRRPDTPADINHLFDARVVLIPLRLGGLIGLFNVWKLRRLLIKLEPDILHLHSSFAGFLGRLSALAALRKTKIFYSPHCISFMRKDIGGAKRYAFVFLERLAALRACKYLACSESEKVSIANHLGIEAIVVENAVPPVARPGRRNGGSQRRLPLEVITVGGIRPQKGPKLFADIARSCHDACLPLAFTWVGDGDEALKHHLEAAGVKVTGWLSRESVIRQVSEADCFLSTAAWEGMPVAVLEAMAVGTTVLATGCAGNLDVIEDGHTGLLFDTVEEAIAGLRGLADGSVEAFALSHHAIDEVARRFNSERFGRDLAHAYFERSIGA